MSRGVFGLGMKVADEEEAHENGRNFISDERDRLFRDDLRNSSSDINVEEVGGFWSLVDRPRYKCYFFLCCTKERMGPLSHLNSDCKTAVKGFSSFGRFRFSMAQWHSWELPPYSRAKPN